ncbi:MAG: hypothetical protein KUG57_04825 [Ilumatobacteraceae bacterium]|nr:hypothetical protein [Ilumatobacteraceae bacterium]
MSDQFAAIFRRRPNDGWFRAGRFDVTTTDIVCALAVATMFVYGFSRESFNKLVFVPTFVRDFEIWRLGTWPVTTEPAVWPLLGIVFFWLFGQQLEALFGRGKFLAWVLMLTFIPAILVTILGPLDNSIDFLVQFGLSTLFLGGIWVYAATYPGVKWFEVVPLWALAAVFTMLNLLQYSGNDQNGQILFLLISVAVALVAGRSLGLATGWPIPHVPLTGTGQPRRRASKQSKPSHRGSSPRVVQGPWKNAPAPAPPSSPAPSPADQIELDSLLDKIGAQGMDSLTGAEKKRLNDLSKRLRNR